MKKRMRCLVSASRFASSTACIIIFEVSRYESRK